MIYAVVFILFSISTLKSYTGAVPDYTYLASLDVCSATIISDTWMVTAAHCFDKNKSNYGKVLIERDSIKRELKYDKIIINPGYKWFQGRVPVNDVALIRLKEPLKFDDKIKPIELTRDKIRMETASVFVDKINSANTSTIKLDVTAMSMENCLNYFGFFLHSTIRPYLKYLDTVDICTKTVMKQSGRVCLGNTGGPIVQNDLLYGIASYFYQYGNSDCERLYFFTNIYNYLSWIKSVIS